MTNYSLSCSLLLNAAVINITHAESMIFFYNPETNINNFSLLKRSFDSYLSKHGEYYFQPFRNRSTFEKHALSDDKSIVIMSSWHYNVLPEEIKNKYIPYMVSTHNGSYTYKKVLVTNINSPSLDKLKGSRLATSSSIEYTQELLSSILGKKSTELVGSINILKVPKDIDALMSVSFGLASVSLTSERNLSNYNKINPNHSRNLNVIKTSNDLLRPLVIVPRNKVDETTNLVSVLNSMVKEESGKTYLKMIGVDSWVKVNKKIQRRYLK